MMWSSARGTLDAQTVDAFLLVAGGMKTMDGDEQGSRETIYRSEAAVTLGPTNPAPSLCHKVIDMF